MIHRRGILFAGIAAAAVACTAMAPRVDAQSATTAEIGKPFKNFTLRDIVSGKMVSLGSYKGKKTVVGIFMQNNCSTTWRYEKKIGDLVRDYRKRGIEVVAIHSSYTESDAEIKGQMDSRNLPIPILDDKKTQALRQYVGAVCTPTFFVVDTNGILRYRGAFDNRPSDTATPYVRPALEAIMDKKQVAITQTRAFG